MLKDKVKEYIWWLLRSLTMQLVRFEIQNTDRRILDRRADTVSRKKKNSISLKLDVKSFYIMNDRMDSDLKIVTSLLLKIITWI